MTLTKASFERIYRVEKGCKRKGKNILLVLNVVYHDKVAAHVVREIHRSRGWACQWLKRYGEEDIEGLKNRPKSGRRPQISEQIENIK